MNQASLLPDLPEPGERGAGRSSNGSFGDHLKAFDVVTSHTKPNGDTPPKPANGSKFTNSRAGGASPQSLPGWVGRER